MVFANYAGFVIWKPRYVQPVYEASMVLRSYIMSCTVHGSKLYSAGQSARRVPKLLVIRSSLMLGDIEYEARQYPSELNEKRKIARDTKPCCWRPIYGTDCSPCIVYCSLLTLLVYVSVCLTLWSAYERRQIEISNGLKHKPIGPAGEP